MTFPGSHSSLFSLLTLSAVWIYPEELCRFSPLKALYSRDFPSTIHHCLSPLSVCVRAWVCHRALPLLVGILPSLWGGDLFRFNRWELGLVLILLRTPEDSLSHRALQIITQRTTISLSVRWVCVCVCVLQNEVTFSKESSKWVRLWVLFVGCQSPGWYVAGHTTLHNHTLRYKQFNLTCVSLDRGRKLEHLDVTHTSTGTTLSSTRKGRQVQTQHVAVRQKVAPH